uniref:Putative zinc-finger domain-containing protein n=1 Tax=uncultured bacterium 413004-H17 TaxID=1343843 RepID=S4W5Z4_9BACT|nr:hypothetical protein [uncultured bacterium 413004-H17]
MDRYQFEDAISAYLDNELPLSERKAFEEFMNANSDAKNLVDSIRTNMTSFKTLSPINASDGFMPNLHKKIEFEKNRPSKKIDKSTFKNFIWVYTIICGNYDGSSCIVYHSRCKLLARIQFTS